MNRGRFTDAFYVVPPHHSTRMRRTDARICTHSADDPDFVAAITAFTPMQRIAEASEIRGTALYLASDASSFVTGLMLVADGGCMAK